MKDFPEILACSFTNFYLACCRLTSMRTFFFAVKSKYQIISVDLESAKKYVRLKNAFYEPHDKGAIDPRNGGYEFPIEEELDDVIFEEGSDIS